MPTHFRELDPELAAKLVEGYENELEPARKELDSFYARQSCPRCQGPCEREFLSAEHSFADGALVPRSGMKCKLCECIFDPHSGIILSTGKAVRSETAQD